MLQILITAHLPKSPKFLLLLPVLLLSLHCYAPPMLPTFTATATASVTAIAAASASAAAVAASVAAAGGTRQM